MIYLALKCPIICVSFLFFFSSLFSVCQFYGFMGGLSGLSSINILTAIAFERCAVIIKANHIQSTKWNTGQTVLMISVPWIYAFLWASLPLFGWNRYTHDETYSVCSFDLTSTSISDRSYIITAGSCAFLIPLVIITSCYTLIFCKVRKYKKRFHKTTEDLQFSIYVGLKVKPQHSQHLKTAQIGFTCVVFFCLAWLPYCIVGWISVFGSYQWVGPKAVLVTSIFAKTAAVYNPIVYAVCHPGLRRRLWYIFENHHPLRRQKARRGFMSSYGSTRSYSSSQWVAMSSSGSSQNRGSHRTSHHSSLQKQKRRSMVTFENGQCRVIF